MKRIRLTPGMRFAVDEQLNEQFLTDLENNLGRIIAGLPVFSMLDPARMREILSLAKLAKYEPGECIIRENQEPSHLHFLISGHVSVSKNNVKLGELRRTGDIFGEMSFIDSAARSATVMARKPTLCLELNLSAIDFSDLDKNSAFLAVTYRVFAEVLAHRLRKMNDELIYLRGELQKAHTQTKR